jgi:hypothetical protein
MFMHNRTHVLRSYDVMRSKKKKLHAQMCIQGYGVYESMCYKLQKTANAVEHKLIQKVGHLIYSHFPNLYFMWILSFLLFWGCPFLFLSAIKSVHQMKCLL